MDDDLNPAAIDFGAFNRLDSRPTVLPFGTAVTGVSRTADFAAVDVEGNGATDGFVLAAFLGQA